MLKPRRFKVTEADLAKGAERWPGVFVFKRWDEFNLDEEIRDVLQTVGAENESLKLNACHVIVDRQNEVLVTHRTHMGDQIELWFAQYPKPSMVSVRGFVSIMHTLFGVDLLGEDIAVMEGEPT